MNAALLLCICYAAALDSDWNQVSHQQGFQDMALLLSAQETREALYHQGEQTVTITSVGKVNGKAEIYIVWEEAGLYVDVRRHISEAMSDTTPTATVRQYEHDPYHFIQGKTETWSYFPARSACHGYGRDKWPKLSPQLEARPLHTWASYARSASKPLSKRFQRNGNPPDLPTTIFEHSGEELARMSLPSLKLVFSRVTGDILECQTFLHSKEHERSFYAEDTEWTWARDQHGTPYCQKWVHRRYAGSDRSELSVTETIDISQYNSRPHTKAKKFTLAAFAPPRGTSCVLSTLGGSKSWKIGGKDEGDGIIEQSQLDSIIMEFELKGFTSSERSP